ncbi:MAG: hypothetical protein IJZ53_13765 [Tyzzerella sp.]|nr:hypothetical protein [Tyzzerella sp.]
MNSAILLVSDIHYTDNKTKSQFWKGDENDYYQKWENFLLELQKNQKIKFKYLVVTGDIADTARKMEYEDFEEILKGLCNRLEIGIENILLVPGNHDIDRAKLTTYCDDNRISGNDAPNLYDIKLGNFKEFYKKILDNKNLEVSNALLDYIYIDEIDTYIVGLNSLAKEGHLDEHHVGYIDIKKLNGELDKFMVGKKASVFVATHHSFAVTGNRELATLKNADVVKKNLGLKEINTFIYGHHHTSESHLDIVGDGGELYRYIEIGSLGKILTNENGDAFTNRFSVAICKDNELDLHDYAYTAGDWLEVNDRKYLHKLQVRQTKQKTEPVSQVEELPKVDDDNEQKVIAKYSKEIVVNENNRFLIEHLKKDNNYKDGHFHWKDGRKTLGWINIPAFLGNIDILNRIKECIMGMHKMNFPNIQVAIGYGMEGNIIGSSLLDYWIENKVSYHLYPSVHKKDEHINREKSLWNEFNEFEKILLICDIMPTTTYLKEIIASDKALQKCSEFFVLALFYNKNLLDGDEQNGAEFPISIKRFALAEIDVPVCKLDKDECMICREGLKKIYEL